MEERDYAPLTLSSPTKVEGPICVYLTKTNQYLSTWDISPSGTNDPQCVTLSEVVQILKDNRIAFQRALPKYLLQTAVGATVSSVILVSLVGPLGLLAGLGLGIILRAAIFTRARQSLLYMLLRYRDIEVDNLADIGDLIDLLRPRIPVLSEHPDIQDWVGQLLPALMPLVLNAEECGITQSRLDVLHTFLTTADRTASLAILKALQFVGNDTSKRYIAARMRRSLDDVELLDVARVVIPAIAERQSRLETKTSLLRAAAETGDLNPNVMLRPVNAPHEEANAEQLLRAGVGRDE